MNTVTLKCFHGNEMTVADGTGVIAVRYLPTRYTGRVGICRCAIEINDVLDSNEAG